MQAVILMGIQGSGKSTFYEQRFASTHLRVSLDLAGTRARERRVLQDCIQQKLDFVVDNTNGTSAHRKAYIQLARENGYQVIGFYFLPDIKTALQRNARRTGKAKIPVPGIYRTLKHLQPPTFGEGFDELWAVESREESGFQLRRILPECVPPVTGS